MAATVQTSGSLTAVLTGTITGITQANPAVVTVTGHGLATGDAVLIAGVVGMTEVNDRRFTITVLTANTFQLDGEDSTGHTAYTSGGTIGEIEQLLASVTTAGTYTLNVDAANLADGENLTLKIYGKARSGDSERLLYEAGFENAQGKPLLASLAVVSPHHARFTLEQGSGTARAFPWAVYAL